MDLRILCAEGLTCNHAGVCAPYASVHGDAGAGDACQLDSDCSMQFLCDLNGTCSSTIRSMLPGEQCVGLMNRCWLGVCKSSDRQAPAVCPQILPDGAQCFPDDATRACDAYAHCLHGVCTMLTLEMCE
jgi:hypothetical protein